MSDCDDSEGETRCGDLVAAAALVLDQCLDLATRCPDDAFCANSGAIRGGTLGKHLRHTLDHFAAATEGAAGMIVEYDRRARNVPMETDRDAARAEIALVRGRVEALGTLAHDAPVRVRVMIASDGREMTLTSTLGRELAFATHHGVHHLAMMRAIAHEFGVPVDDATGTAPSTLHAAARMVG